MRSTLSPVTYRERSITLRTALRGSEARTLLRRTIIKPRGYSKRDQPSRRSAEHREKRRLSRGAYPNSPEPG